MTGKLLLLPNALGDLTVDLPKPPVPLQGLIVEDEKEGRRYLRRFLTREEMVAIPLALLNEHTRDRAPLLSPMLRGETWGLISDAGLPCIADPGSELVWEARQKGVEIGVVGGSCSILMALQLSGFSGQQFSFHGYLPREEGELVPCLERLEKTPGAQIWIEAPYRSGKMIDFVLRTLTDTTRFCVAASLDCLEQKVQSATIAQWKKKPLVLGKEPAVFLVDGDLGKRQSPV